MSTFLTSSATSLFLISTRLCLSPSFNLWLSGQNLKPPFSGLRRLKEVTLQDSRPPLPVALLPERARMSPQPAGVLVRTVTLRLTAQQGRHSLHPVLDKTQRMPGILSPLPIRVPLGENESVRTQGGWKHAGPWHGGQAAEHSN